MQALSIDYFNHFELDDVFANGVSCANWRITTKSNAPSQETRIPIAYLIAGSDLFRSAILNMKTSAAFCALISTRLGTLVSRTQLKSISEKAAEFQSSRPGAVIYTTSEQEVQWFVLVSGKLKLKATRLIKDHDAGLHNVEAKGEDEPEFCHEINEGEIFGGLIAQELCDKIHISIEVLNPSTLFKLRPEDMNNLIEEDTETAKKIFKSIEGKQINFS